jgi:uncharacterized membrane-anchored protein YjiN (DUF445 family)
LPSCRCGLEGDRVRPTALVPLVLTAVLAAGALAGCGQSKADKANDKVCDARDNIAQEIKDLQGLTITTATVDEISSSLKAIRDNLADIGKAQGDLSDQRRKDVQAANEAFKATMSQIAGSIGKSLSIQNAATQTKQALQQLAESYRASFGKLDCS